MPFGFSKDSASRPVLDLGYLEYWREIAGEELPAFLDSLIVEFEGEYDRRLADLRVICEKRDQKELSTVLHRLAGSIGNLGMSRASATCRYAEYAARHGDFDEFDTLVPEVEARVAEGLRALREYAREQGK